MRHSYRQRAASSLARVIACLALLLGLMPAVVAPQTKTAPDAEGFLQRGLELTKEGNYKAAIEAFSRSISIRPEDAEAYYRRGLVIELLPEKSGPLSLALVATGIKEPFISLPATAAGDYEKAIRYDPGLLPAYLRLAEIKNDLSYLDRAIEVKRDSAEAYYQRGRLRASATVEYLARFKRTGRFFEDEELFRKLGLSGKSSNEALAVMQRIVRQAVDDYTKALSLMPDYAAAYLGRARSHFVVGEYRPAIEDSTQAIKLSSQSAAAYETRGAAWFQLRNYLAALKDFDRALRLAPQSADLYDERGLARTRNGEREKAVKDYLQSIRLGDWAKEKDFQLHRLGTQGQVFRLYYERGLEERYQNGGGDAVAYFTHAIEAKPDFADVYFQRALSLRDARKNLEAVADFSRAIGLSPDNADYYYSRALTLAAAGDYRKAAEDLTASLRLNSEVADIHFHRARAYSSAGEHRKAIADFTQSISAGVRVAESYFRRGLSHHLSGDAEKAAADYMQVIKSNHLEQDNPAEDLSGLSADALAVYYRGVARLSLPYAEKEAEEVWPDENYPCAALEDFSRVIEAEPGAAAAYYRRGTARRVDSDRCGETAATVPLADFDKALNLNPDSAWAYFARAGYHLTGEDGSASFGESRAKAVADLSQAIRLAPNWARAYFLRGNAHSKYTGDPGADIRKALADYTRVIELRPDWGEAYGARAAVNLELKDLQGALADYTKLTELRPKDASAYLTRGEFRLYQLKDYRGAIEDLERVLELKPAEPDSGDKLAYTVYLNLGKAHYELGEGLKALEDFEQARIVLPCPGCKGGSNSLSSSNQGDKFFKLGRSLFYKGDKAGAKRNLEQAAKLYRTAGHMKKYQNALYEISKL